MFYWIISILVLAIIIFYYFNNKRSHRSFDEVRDIIRSYVSEKDEEKKWDEFICCKIQNPYLENIRKQCLRIYEKDAKANENGKEILLNYIDKLNNEIAKRKIVSEFAKQFYNKEISSEEFFDKIPNSDDDEINQLLEIITHEPKIGGFGGTSEEGYKKYRNELKNCIDNLSKSCITS